LVRIRREARIILVNTKLVPEADRPKSILDLTSPKWKGKVAIASRFSAPQPHTRRACSPLGRRRSESVLSRSQVNHVQLVSGNKQVAQAVGSGQVLIGMTDTDDAMEELAADSPVAIIYPDRESGELGTLFIPNTLAAIKKPARRRGCRQAGKRAAQSEGRRSPGERAIGTDSAQHKDEGKRPSRDPKTVTPCRPTSKKPPSCGTKSLHSWRKNSAAERAIFVSCGANCMSIVRALLITLIATGFR